MILTFLSRRGQVLPSVWVDSDTHTFHLWLDIHLEKKHHSRPSAFGKFIFVRIDPQHCKSVQQTAKGSLFTAANSIIQTGVGKFLTAWQVAVLISGSSYYYRPRILRLSPDRRWLPPAECRVCCGLLPEVSNGCRGGERSEKDFSSRLRQRGTGEENCSVDPW
jgi:hypothetical protein